MEEKNRNIQELFEDLLNNGNMEETGRTHPREIIHPKVGEIPFQANEALNVLRGNIQMSGYNLKAIAVTSSLAHEGKSSIAFRLAKSMAGLEKRVLYMDCDIRNSHTASRYSIEGKHPGFSEYLCGKISKDHILYRTDDPWLDMMFTGASAPNPSELVSGELFVELMAYVRNLYDYIIVDTPPLNAVIDGVLIAKQCDGAIMVIESGFTERAQAEKARSQMEYAGIKILGAVLNKADMSRRRYGYGRKYGYGYGYGYGKNKESEKKGKKKQHAKKK